jgi:hypothetical protein
MIPKPTGVMVTEPEVPGAMTLKSDFVPWADEEPMRSRAVPLASPATCNVAVVGVPDSTMGMAVFLKGGTEDTGHSAS